MGGFMMMKRALAVILAAGFAVGSYATDARVAVMGRQTTPYFYRDEVSVFINPADMSLYPNLIYGSFGWLNPMDKANAYEKMNLLPKDPLFGGMISYGFSDEESGPMLSIGAFMNRHDYMLDRLMEEGGMGQYESNQQSNYRNNLVDPLGKIDVLLGYDIGNGLAIGAGFYTAYQCKRIANEFATHKTSLFKGTLGINYNIEQGLDLEASVNVASTGAMYIPPNKDEVDSNRVTVSNGDYAMRGDVRFFSAVPSINGSFVPQVSLEYWKLSGSNYEDNSDMLGNTIRTRWDTDKEIIDLAGGIGINMNIDRGFFWTGLQGIYRQENNGDDDPQRIGARLSFGIERNIVWDWFLIRVGGQKEFVYKSWNHGDNSSWEENTPSDGSDKDLVGLGFGINIDNRLRIDFVASEDLPYTLTNLISGNQNHLFNRVSATYRF
jgi:hypothetical protein